VLLEDKSPNVHDFKLAHSGDRWVESSTHGRKVIAMALCVGVGDGIGVIFVRELERESAVLAVLCTSLATSNRKLEWILLTSVSVITD